MKTVITGQLSTKIKQPVEKLIEKERNPIMHILHTTPRTDGFCMPAEFDRHAGCLLIWPTRGDSWRSGGWPARKAFAAVAAAIARSEEVTMLVAPEQYETARAMREMFAQIGENCYIEPPLHANWGGRHVHFGSGVYANFNLTLVDDAHIYVGDCVMFGPNVTVATAGHPIEPGLRRQAMQYNADVRIGSNVWVAGLCGRSGRYGKPHAWCRPGLRLGAP